MLVNVFNKNSTKMTSFQAMKPNQFKCLDYAAVRKFKAPVERFNSISDLQSWASAKIEMLKQKDYKSGIGNIDVERKIFLNKWIDFLSNKCSTWSETKKLITFFAMVKDLKKNNDVIPPIIDETLLNRTFALIERDLEQNKDLSFDLNRRYKDEMKTFLLKDISPDYSGWVVLPSKRNNEKDFIHNVEKLKLLSTPFWCIKKWAHAESYLKSGDFHIYLEKGVPKLCIKFSGAEIIELQGERNNATIPKEYIDMVKKYIKDGKYLLNEDMEYYLECL